ncbi:hypothetical protein K2V75_11050 [Staphylococcus gallinarum]|uniref:hypothetical protein n=1 Tax=Staphylococcus gallinarum TaxID=1293 RepID=UPI001E2F5094|nr:hypothetical protein [Staphylococcus gallinarum]MCD8910677.1 hypothetical protein [Staphylococcus gallinarum]
MKCIIELKNDKTITVDNFNCIEYPKRPQGEISQYKIENIESINLLNDVTYTIIGGTIAKVRGEDILFIHFR